MQYHAIREDDFNFLEIARRKDEYEINPIFRYFLAYNHPEYHGLWITTDGYRMHVVCSEENLNPGAYEMSHMDNNYAIVKESHCTPSQTKYKAILNTFFKTRDGATIPVSLSEIPESGSGELFEEEVHWCYYRPLHGTDGTYTLRRLPRMPVSENALMINASYLVSVRDFELYLNPHPLTPWFAKKDNKMACIMPGNIEAEKSRRKVYA